MWSLTSPRATSASAPENSRSSPQKDFCNKIDLADICGAFTIRAQTKETAMTKYTVGLKLETRKKALTIEAEDALLAVLKIKLEDSGGTHHLR
jgi:hypothetical protein